MSAFVVDKEHIDAMVAAGLPTPSSFDGLQWARLPVAPGQSPGSVPWSRLEFATADKVGAMLLEENYRSVLCRYPDCDRTNVPGPISPPQVQDYTFPVTRAPRLAPVEALKAIDCYEYQACEHAEWPSSEAFRFCDALRRHVIHRLPGYEAATWGWRQSKSA